MLVFSFLISLKQIHLNVHCVNQIPSLFIVGSEKNRQYHFEDFFGKCLNDLSSKELEIVELAILHVKFHVILLAKAQA